MKIRRGMIRMVILNQRGCRSWINIRDYKELIYSDMRYEMTLNLYQILHGDNFYLIKNLSEEDGQLKEFMQ